MNDSPFYGPFNSILVPLGRLCAMKPCLRFERECRIIMLMLIRKYIQHAVYEYDLPCLTKICTSYRIEISAEKTKPMKNSANSVSRDILNINLSLKLTNNSPLNLLSISYVILTTIIHHA